VIERIFAGFGRNRRIAKDNKGSIQSALAFIHLATIQLLLRRLAPGQHF
jgi:putative transposase